jgi:PAS domain S-box-containing protein
MSNIIQGLSDILLVIDQNATIQFINRAGEDLLGYLASDLMGQPIGRIVGESNLQFFKVVRELIKTGRSQHCDIYLVSFSGEMIPASFNGSVLHDSSNQIYAIIGLLRDMREYWRLVRELEEAKSGLEEKIKARTSELADAYRTIEKAYEDLKMAQAHLLQSEKMASIGQLAAGVAHEINNPIGFISSNLRTLEEYLGDITKLIGVYESLLAALNEGNTGMVADRTEQAKTLSGRIDIGFILSDIPRLTSQSLDGAQRVQRIVQSLKDFSHIDQAELELFNLNNGIESTLDIVWNELKYKAEVVKELGEIPEILCYPQQLNQVFMDLLVNAAQAIEKKGKVWIRSYARDGHVVVEIEDTGCGIKPEQLSKIFDPFFTTKPIGKGIGLGLSASYGIVQKHGGKIEAASEGGKGAKFTIYLPTKGFEVKT